MSLRPSGGARFNDRGGQPRKSTQVNAKPNGYVNKNVDSAMHYPPASPRDPPTASIPGEDWTLPKKMNNRNELLRQIDRPQWPLRQNFSVDSGKVVTNHFTCTVSADAFYEYKIIGFPSRNRKDVKALFRQAVQAWPFLQQNRRHFASNNFDTIVSWKCLHDQPMEANLEQIFGRVTLEQDSGIANHPTWAGPEFQSNNRPIALEFQFVRKFSVQDLDMYSMAHPQHERTNFIDMARCLNILIAQSLGNDVHKQSANKFFVKTARKCLGQSQSLETIRGYFYNIKPGMGNIILNFNIATSAFVRPILVSELLADSSTFSIEEAEALLKKLRVYIEHERHYDEPDKVSRLNSEQARLQKVCGLSQVPISKLTFRNKKRDEDGKFMKDDKNDYMFEGPEFSVMDHLTTVFREPVDAHLKAVNVGKKDDPVWHAQEFLRIVPFQVYTKPVPDHLTQAMVQEACRDPAVSRAMIQTEGLSSLGFVPGDRSKTFNLRNDVPIQLHSGMLHVPSLVLAFPQVYYKNPVNKRASNWPMPNDAKFRFLTTREKPFKYVLLKAPGVNDTSLGYYDNLLRAHIARCGFNAGQAQNVNPANNKLVPSLAGMEPILKFAQTSDVNLVILVLPKADRFWYRSLKNICERKFGLHSVCMVENLKKNDNAFVQYMQNISMKLNLKFGGINHTAFAPTERFPDTMFLGADLIHAPSGTIAAIVGSVDPAVGRCLGSVRLQDVQKSDHEIIYTVEDMVYERLLHWAYFSVQHQTKKLPDNIIYYRDGVSHGHYEKVKKLELTAIDRAYAKARTALKMTPQPVRLTAVIVTKRHHTRFYVLPGQQGDKWGNGNTLPGTSVDKLVTSPYYQDFFLQSHSGIKGTVKPTHYFVLRNDIPSLTLNKLRDLTHKLCYSYCRATVGVSYVAPTYYADRLCERAALYMKEISPDGVPWPNPRPREPNGSFKWLREVDNWFKKIEHAFYPHREIPEVPAWGKYAPWKSQMADTMFWM